MKSSFSPSDCRSIQYLSTKHQFIPRLSILNTQFEGMHYNMFNGLYNCVKFMIWLYLISNSFIRFNRNGEFFDSFLMKRIKTDLIICLCTWPLFYVWSHVALIIQLYARNLGSEIIVQFIQHFTQCLMFLFPHYLVAKNQLFVTHGIYISFQACVFIMKMHSYNDVNNKLRTSKNTIYPNNISFSNFTLYMWMPVLVYQVEYPRTNSINIRYLFNKFISSLILVWLAYQIVSDHILVLIEHKQDYTIIESMSHAFLPVIIVCFISFLMVFENYLNFFAELTRFADRLFYFDWWNANGIEDFNRKWNRPVYMFLYKHVYSEAIQYGCSRQLSQLITITISALFHEFCIAVALQTFSPILLICMIFQIPIFVLIKYYRITVMQTNIFMWFSLIVGVPLVVVLYVQTQ